MTLPDLDQVVFDSPVARAGAFRCRVDDPRFRDSGPIQGHLVAFPRSPVMIRQSGSATILADTRTATIYNLGRSYERMPLSPDGDRSDWFAVSPETALAIAQEHDPLPPDRPETAFRFEYATTEGELYFRQRRLFLRLERGAFDQLEAEEEILRLIGAVIQRAAGQPPHWRELSSRGARAHAELVASARTLLATEFTESIDLTTLAQRLGTSPYHLCRVFRRGTGLTLNNYRLDLRLRLAVERLADPRVDLSRLAHDLGFSSHSHFTARLRHWFGAPPSVLRAALQ
ncbi:MAG: AraC family transcriptional regulator [Gemmatimonadota bacterium]